MQGGQTTWAEPCLQVTLDAAWASFEKKYISELIQIEDQASNRCVALQGRGAGRFACPMTPNIGIMEKKWKLP